MYACMYIKLAKNQTRKETKKVGKRRRFEKKGRGAMQNLAACPSSIRGLGKLKKKDEV